MADDRPIVNMIGERVALGPIRREVMLPLMHRWFNDFGVTRNWIGLPKAQTDEAITALYDRVFARENGVSFALYELTTWRPVGVIGLAVIDHQDRTAEFWIMIGEPDARGKGLGTEATRLMLDYAFTALGLSNVILEVWEFNLAGIRAYENAGFREVGRRRLSKFMGGKMWDVVFMDAIADEFDSPLLAKVLSPDQPR